MYDTILIEAYKKGEIYDKKDKIFSSIIDFYV